MEPKPRKKNLSYWVATLSLRVFHNLTFYHFRHDRHGPHKLAICSCGKNFGIFRKIQRKTRRRGVVCIVRGHRWNDGLEQSFGPINGPPDMLWTARQCDFCYRVELSEDQ